MRYLPVLVEIAGGRFRRTVPDGAESSSSLSWVIDLKRVGGARVSKGDVFVEVW